jgi:hypothetical protein
MRTATKGAAIPLVTAAIALVTVLNRLGVIPLRDLAASPDRVADGREWLLLTSAFVADRPVLPSIAGFAIVGAATWLACGGRVLWTAAIGGHLVATVAVYAALDVAGVTITRADFGTSAIIAAWIGALAYWLYRRGLGRFAVALCLAVALVGWLLRPELDLLDTEHAVALPIGVATAAWVPRLRVLHLRKPLARWALLLHSSLLRQ